MIFYICLFKILGNVQILLKDNKFLRVVQK